jgi:hypothetical protein
LHIPDDGGDGHAGAGNTHAWAQVYLPGPGWVDFDPAGDVRAAIIILALMGENNPPHRKSKPAFSGRPSLSNLDPLGSLGRLEPLAFARYLSRFPSE